MQDCQPFSVLKDKGFKACVNKLANIRPAHKTSFVVERNFIKEPNSKPKKSWQTLWQLA